MTYNYPKDGVWAYVYRASLAPLENPQVVATFEFERQELSRKRVAAGTKGGRPKRQMELFGETNLLQTPPNQFATNPTNQFATDPRNQFATQTIPPSPLRSEGKETTPKTDPSAVSTAEIESEQAFYSPRPVSPEERGGTPPAPPVVLSSEAKEENQTENPSPVLDERLEEFWCEDIFKPEGYLLAEIMPKPSVAAIERGLPVCRRILAHFAEADKYAGVAAGLVLKYNRAHRGQKYATKEDRVMYLRTPEQYLKALESDNATLMNDYLTHVFEKCELCAEAGVGDYRDMVRHLEQRERERKAQRIADEARRMEEERQAKLCARCKRYPHGSMSLEQGKDYRNNAIMVRVCDGCYDGAYELRKRGLDPRLNALDKRPDYAPPKFDTTTATPEVTKALTTWFAENGKVGDWSTKKEERAALGVGDEHATGVLRHLHKDQEKVTREQFIALLLECAAERPKAAEPEPMAYAAGDAL